MCDPNTLFKNNNNNIFTCIALFEIVLLLLKIVDAEKVKKKTQRIYIKFKNYFKEGKFYLKTSYL